MLEDRVLIPAVLEGKEFYAGNLDEALTNCQSEGFEAVFMPAIADARIGAPKEARVWRTWYSAPSIRATGRSKQGNAAVVYAHVPNYFSDPENIKEAINQGLVGGAGVMPQAEFQRLLDLEDNESVFVVDYDALKAFPSEVIPLKNALEHTQTVPFLGGEERAQRYLERHKEVFGDKMGVWHSDDLSDQPLGRLPFLGDDYLNSLNGSYNLSSLGRFVGVRAGGAGKGLDSQLGPSFNGS